jgi:serine/threonine-protein kinase/endoribonuclease IRE1
VKRHFGELPAGFLLYFTSRYPLLFLHVYSVVRDSRLRHESMFEQYFQEG